MNNTTTPETVLDFPENGEQGLPTMLNVLTILTFIGCVIELYNQVRNFISGTENIENIKKVQETMDQMPAWAGRFVGPDILEIAQKEFENRVPLLIIGLLSIGLCTYGAIEMRRLKKQGYILWLTGELLPIVGYTIFIGTVIFKTTFAFFIMLFPLIFIILYTLQKKYLKTETIPTFKISQTPKQKSIIICLLVEVLLPIVIIIISYNLLTLLNGQTVDAASGKVIEKVIGVGGFLLIAFTVRGIIKLFKML